MKKLLVVFFVWLSPVYAVGEGKIATDCCKLTLHDKECAATVAAVGGGTISVVGCGVYMGGLCIKEGLLIPATVMSLGAGTACIGWAGAIACAMCSSHYGQQAREMAVTLPVAMQMLSDSESQTI